MMKYGEFAEKLLIVMDLARDANNQLKASKPNEKLASDDELAKYYAELKASNAYGYDLYSFRVRSSLRELDDITEEMKQSLNELLDFNTKIDGYVGDIATAKEALVFIAQLVLVCSKVFGL
ncbi:hypothetical protein [Acinetobacter sp. ANC 3791]|uniref:hypothetical protein n=1 Tax=Acinetobacter sp. ANC 3791 TaxID=2529836 RepID=UPI00103F519D|nr:hypothetical protein [Acinetobacter sp. ANC 3791]TCB83408.1 hypothetical protein E0H90_11810 [Acinetobacter sp. ANC 3791]